MAKPATTGSENLIVGRKWDFLLVAVLTFGLAAVFHVTHMLTVGDWDFWADWKDRQWWPLITPSVAIIIPAATQYLVWRLFGAPFGATAAAVSLALAQWISRTFSFTAWVYFPLGFVMPATLIPQAIVMDITLALTRSILVTGFLGAIVWGFSFQFVNWPLFRPWWQPALYHGHLLTAADVAGFEYLRSQAPSYLRVVEMARLRAFLEQITLVTAFTAAVLSILGYWTGYLLARFLGLAPANRLLRIESPLARLLYSEAQDENRTALTPLGVDQRS